MSVVKLIERRQWIGRAQRIDILNVVANGIVRYMARIVPFNQTQITEMETAARRVVYRKSWRVPKVVLYAPRSEGGLGLDAVGDIITESIVGGITMNGIHADAKLTRETSIARVNAMLIEAESKALKSNELQAPEEELKTKGSRRDKAPMRASIAHLEAEGFLLKMGSDINKALLQRRADRTHHLIDAEGKLTFEKIVAMGIKLNNDQKERIKKKDDNGWKQSQGGIHKRSDPGGNNVGNERNGASAKRRRLYHSRRNTRGGRGRIGEG